MAERPDYYQILGLDEHAPAEAIKKAYRACARAHHPDRHPDDAKAAERFKGVTEAYDVLSDPARRQQYDLLRQHPLNTFGRFPTAADFGPPPGPTPRRASLQIRLSFEQALRGGKAKVHLPDGRPLHVPIPRGVRDGLRLRLRNEHPGASEPDALFVTFRVALSPRFQRSGDHLLTRETISVFDALFGTERRIENAYGQPVALPIPPGTQPGERLRLSGQGVATDAHTGDLFVDIAVTIPRDLTDEQHERLRAAAEEAGLL
ncbi:MAG: DnaJ C-terminal domain-containing protein [Rhodothermales bacterium]